MLVYSGARCLVKGCNPYDGAQLQREFAEGFGSGYQGPPWTSYNAAYPPSALALVIPFALMPWNAASIIWLWAGAALYITAAYCMVDLTSSDSSVSVPILIACFLAGSTVLLYPAQPACAAIGLCVIATWALLRNRWLGVAVICFALSLTLKPQMGCFIWLYFFLASADYRRKAIYVALATMAFSLPGILIAGSHPQSRHWMADMSQNIKDVGSNGNLCDPGPRNKDSTLVLDLQTIVSVFRDDTSVENHIAWAVSGVMIGIWAFITLRAAPSTAKDYLGLASVAVLTLLPVYHRHHDARLLLLMFPAIAFLKTERRILYMVGACLTVILMVFLQPKALDHLLHLNYTNVTSIGAVRYLIEFRRLQILLACMGGFYLIVYARLLKFRWGSDFGLRPGTQHL